MRIPLTFLDTITEQAIPSKEQTWVFDSRFGNKIVAKLIQTSEGQVVVDFEVNPED